MKVILHESKSIFFFFFFPWLLGKMERDILIKTLLRNFTIFDMDSNMDRKTTK